MNADTDRLVKVLGMLGSAHDGEVVAAARQAERIRADAGLTWGEIIFTPPMPRNGQRPRGDIIDDLLAHIDFLTEWERNFLRSLKNATRISDRQIAVIERIRKKVRSAGVEL